jgi:hypothetical protein
MLQEFLSSNFITLTEDANLIKLKKASDELVKKLQKTKSKVIPYTLVALDPDIPADNQDVAEVSEVITKHWPTFAGNSKDTPLTYIRAVMLQALETISADVNIACLIWLSGRNIVRRYNLGKQKNLLTTFIESIGNTIEGESAAKWSLPGESKLEKSSLDVKSLSGEAIDKAELDKILKEVRVAINKLLGESQNEIEQRRVLQLRTHLLWWKEACYSPSLNRSYRELNPGVLQIILASDYSSYIPSIFPLSVDYFLRETSLDLTLREDKKYKLSDLFKLIDSSIELKEMFSGYVAEQRRISLLDFVKGIAIGVYNTKQLKILVGLKETEEIALSEFSVWIFHELLAQKIINSK